MSYMLAIEPHPNQADVLRNNVGRKTRARLIVVDSIGAAVSEINREVPALVLLSALTRPHEEAQLLARLRHLPEASIPDILIIPSLDGLDNGSGSKQTLLDLLRRRKRPARLAPSAFAVELSQRMRNRRRASSRPPSGLTHEAAGAERRAALRLERLDGTTVLIDGAAVDVIDLSVTGAQVVAARVLLPRGSVSVVLSRNEDIFCLEAAVVWGGFEIIGPGRTPLYRAGIRFNDADFDSLNRLFSDERALPGQAPWHGETPMPLIGETVGDKRRCLPPAQSMPGEVSVLRTPVDRSARAERRIIGDMPWYPMAKLPWGLEVRVLNISRTGLLLESGCRLEPGRITELTLCGPGKEVVVPASIVRSEVAVVSKMGVKYHIGATFEQPFDVGAAEGSRAATSPPAQRLSHLLAALSSDLGTGSHASRRIALERNIRQVVSAREIQIGGEPIPSADGGVSMSFAAATSSGGQTIVHALFDSRSEPSEVERKLLRAAAGLAAMLQEFDEHPACGAASAG